MLLLGKGKYEEHFFVGHTIASGGWQQGMGPNFGPGFNPGSQAMQSAYS